eukprot:Tbor_TRINITY_DN5797_c3_g4::TRINITY_DN5797_c3_g4_i2::g.20198::m.20198
MKFKLFGGLDCPDAVLAQLSILGNTTILSNDALESLTEQIVTCLILNRFQGNIFTASCHSTVISSVNGSSWSHSKEGGGDGNNNNNDARQLIYEIFSDVIRPIIMDGGSKALGGRNDLDGFAVKIIDHVLARRELQSKQAAAELLKFTSSSGNTPSQTTETYKDPANSTTILSSKTTDVKPNSRYYMTPEKIDIAIDGLAQCCVAIATLISNMVRFSLSNDVFLQELTMLGLAPESVEKMLMGLDGAVGGLLLCNNNINNTGGNNNNNNNDNGSRGNNSDGMSPPVRALRAVAIDASLIIGSGYIDVESEGITVDPIIRTSILKQVRESMEALVNAEVDGNYNEESVQNIKKEETIANIIKKTALRQREGGIGEEIQEETVIYHVLKLPKSQCLKMPISSVGQPHNALEYINASNENCTESDSVITVEMTTGQAQCLLSELVLARDCMVCNA